MACLITAGITRDCGFSFGGLQKVWLMNASEVTKTGIIHELADGNITTIPMLTGTFPYEYEFEPETGQALQELQAGNVSRFVLQTLNLSLAGITQAKRNELESLANADLMVIYEDQNAQKWLFGEYGRGLRATILTVDTGTADADDYVVQISLAGGSAGYADTTSVLGVAVI